MKSRSARFRRKLWLHRLEDRLAPAGVVSLVNSAAPTLYADTASGDSRVGWETPSQQLHTRVVSDNGQFIVYLSTAPNLVTNQVDLNNGLDLFVYDRLANSTELITHKAGVTLQTSDGAPDASAISADGRFITFESTASDLVAGMTKPPDSIKNIFLYDRQNKTCKLVSHSVNDPLVGNSFTVDEPAISADGSIITFTSQSTNLSAGFPNPGGLPSVSFLNAYVYDASTNQITLVNHTFSSPTTPGNASAQNPELSSDGRYVTFQSKATNLLSSATTNKSNIYRYDRQTNQIVLISNNNGSAPLGGDNDSVLPTITDDGRWIAFTSKATNLVAGASVSGNQVYLCDATTGIITLISHSHSGLSTGGSGLSFGASTSTDGRYVAFVSQATNLVAGYVSGHGGLANDVYLYDRVTHQMALVNHKAGMLTHGDKGATGLPLLSTDGRFVVFPDLGTNLISGFADSNGEFENDVYRYDRDAGSLALLSGKNGSPSVGALGDSQYAAMNRAGSAVAWTSWAGDIMSSVTDTNGRDDVYVRDLTAGTTQLASRRQGPPSNTPGGTSDWVRQSADGRYIVFTSYAPNLVSGQVSTASRSYNQNVFLRDQQTGLVVLVSHAHNSVNTTGNRTSAIPVISADGRFVAYTSTATDLVPGFVDANETFTGADVYLYDRLNGTNTLISHQVGSGNVSGNQGSSDTSHTPPNHFLTISADGRYVGFPSYATDLVNGFVNNNSGNSDVYVYDRLSGTNALVSHDSASLVAGSNSTAVEAKLSADGKYLVYRSDGSNLITGMTGGGGRNVYLYDVQAQVNVLVSHAFSGPTVSSNAGSNAPSISPDGRFVLFQSAANNIIAGQVDTNNLDDVFLFDRMTGENVLVSHAHDSLTTAGDRSSRPFSGNQNDARIISADGRYIVYKSGASNLVSGFVDNNGVDVFDDFKTDIFLYDRWTGSNTLVSHTMASTVNGGNDSSEGPYISNDGRFVVYHTGATNLTAGIIFPGSLVKGIVLYDRLIDKTTSLVSQVPGNDVDATESFGSLRAVISDDGRVVTFLSDQRDLASNDLNGFTDVFAYVVSPPTVTSVVFGDGTNQRSLVKRIVVTFSEPVSFMGSVASAFTLARTGPGGTTGNVTLTVNPTSGPASSVTITFAGDFSEHGSLVDGVYDFTISSAQVSGVGGALDGNADGAAGGSYVVVGSSSNSFYRLFGDADGNRTANLFDMSALITAMNQPSAIFDFDDKGFVFFTDFERFRERFNLVV